MSETTHPVARAMRMIQDAEDAHEKGVAFLNDISGGDKPLNRVANNSTERRLFLGGYDLATAHHADELTRVRERADLAERAQSQFNMEAESEIRSHDRTKQQLDALKRSNDTLRERVQELEQATTLQPLDREKVRTAVQNAFMTAYPLVWINESGERIVNAITDAVMQFGTPPITDAACVARLVQSGWVQRIARIDDGRAVMSATDDLTRLWAEMKPRDRIVTALIAPSEP